MNTGITNIKNKFISHVLIGDQRIIPFDTFEIGDNEYSLLKIVPSENDGVFLKLLVIDGPQLSDIYLVPKDILETHSVEEMEKELTNYKINS